MALPFSKYVLVAFHYNPLIKHQALSLPLKEELGGFYILFLESSIIWLSFCIGKKKKLCFVCVFVSCYVPCLHISANDFSLFINGKLNKRGGFVVRLWGVRRWVPPRCGLAARWEKGSSQPDHNPPGQVDLWQVRKKTLQVKVTESYL